MTTYAYGSWIGALWRSVVAYDVTTTNTQVTVIVREGTSSYVPSTDTFVHAGTWLPDSKYGSYWESGYAYDSVSLSIGGTTVYSGVKSGATDKDYTKTFDRTHVNQTIQVVGSNTTPSNGTRYYNASYTKVEAPGTSTARASITIPAKPSYAITYNANGGTGAPSAQTKWYGETLTLSPTAPTRTQYKFMGWNTKPDGTGANYSPGATYAGNAPLALYAVWRKSWDKPTLSNLSAARCDSNGNADPIGGYLKVSVDWTIDSVQLEHTQSAPSAFSVSAACTGHSQSWSNSGVPSGLSGTRTVILGDGTARPDAQYALSASVTDVNSSASSSASLAADAGYFKPRISVSSCAISDSSGNSDPLGGYASTELSYEVYGSEPPESLVVEYVDGSESELDTDAASGTANDLAGSFGYSAMPPTGGSRVGVAILADKFNETAVDVVADATEYTPPSISSLRCYRCDDQGDYADEGGFAAVEFDWSVFASGTQTAPDGVSVVLMEEATGRIIATRAYTPSGTSGSADYVLTPQPGDSTSTDWATGETVLMVADKVYSVTVALADLYAQATGYDSISMAYYTLHARPGGHGIAFGQPSTMEAFEVGMPAYFNDGVSVTKGQVGGTPWDDLLGTKWGQHATTTWYTLSRITRTVPDTQVEIADGTVSVFDSGDMLVLLDADGLVFYDENGVEKAFYGMAQMAKKVTWNNLKGIRSAT